VRTDRITKTQVNYIKNQQKHHQKENMQDEIKRLWIENGMELDARYFA